VEAITTNKIKTPQFMKFLKMLAFLDGRKVGFGLWLFIVACAFLMKKLIASSDWITCVILASGLVGGGTVADKWLSSKSEEKVDIKKD
jgi:inosine-uridine nucleoside N-ribohydrolase